MPFKKFKLLFSTFLKMQAKTLAKKPKLFILRIKIPTEKINLTIWTIMNLCAFTIVFDFCRYINWIINLFTLLTFIFQRNEMGNCLLSCFHRTSNHGFIRNIHCNRWSMCILTLLVLANDSVSKYICFKITYNILLYRRI